MRLGTEQSLCQSYIHIVITLRYRKKTPLKDRPKTGPMIGTLSSTFNPKQEVFFTLNMFIL